MGKSGTHGSCFIYFDNNTHRHNNIELVHVEIRIFHLHKYIMDKTKLNYINTFVSPIIHNG